MKETTKKVLDETELRCRTWEKKQESDNVLENVYETLLQNCSNKKAR